MCNAWRTLSMAYFLKKTKRNDRLYLSIYESFYSPETKNTRHKSFRKIGFVDALIEQGIDDPISHFPTFHQNCVWVMYQLRKS